MGEFLKWSETYKIGNRVIDYQHERLFNIVNILYDGRHDPKIQKDCLEALQLYISQHFLIEEEIMKAYGHPAKDFTKHCEEHKKFSERIEAFCQAVEDGETVLTELVIEYLKKWISHHVLKSDCDIIPTLKWNKDE